MPDMGADQSGQILLDDLVICAYFRNTIAFGHSLALL